MAGLQLLATYDSDQEDIIPMIHDGNLIQSHEQDPRVKETDGVVCQEVLLVLSNIVDSVVRVFQSQNQFRGQYRTTKNECEIDLTDDSDSSSWSLKSDTESETSSGDEDDQVLKNPRKNRPLQPYKGPKTKGELTLEDLPPLEDLRLTCPCDELTHIGRVSSILDRVVVVQSFKSQFPLDLDTVLFMKDGTTFGSIFDVFGPVIEPRYVVRFNEHEDIDKKNIMIDTPVYYAATLQPPYTSYVFTRDLLKMKGSDASWKHNNEPPEDVQEFSDDEQERRAKNAKRRRKLSQ
jgi:H/ACA ribonucleoprotein complex non-core subunit NAF1